MMILLTIKFKNKIYKNFQNDLIKKNDLKKSHL